MRETTTEKTRGINESGSKEEAIDCPPSHLHRLHGAMHDFEAEKPDHVSNVNIRIKTLYLRPHL